MTNATGIGLIGLGTVGSAVARRLVDDWELLGSRAGSIPVLRRVAVADPTRGRDPALPRVHLDGDADALVDDEAVAVVVEVMGGVDRASALIERALRAGKPVVTANKAAMAAHGLELSRLAVECGVSLRYEAAVGAGLPVVALLRDSLRGDRVTALEMIINGTTNVILTRMGRDGVDFATALRDAQERGFAEAKPSADVDGHDAAAKLVLLSRLAFDAPVAVDDVTRMGIRGVVAQDVAAATQLGGAIKLVAAAQGGDGFLTLSVGPALVRPGHPLFGVDDADNAVLITSDLAGPIRLSGAGAGGHSTASAVLSDIVATVRDPAAAPPVPGAGVTTGDSAGIERGGYLRLRLQPIPEATELVLQALEDRGIPVRASVSLDEGGAGAQLALLTGSVSRAMRERAAETLDSLAAVAEVVAVMDWLEPA